LQPEPPTDQRKHRFISDEFFAGALWGFGMAIIISLWLNRAPDGKFHGAQQMALAFGMLCMGIGSWLYRIVQHRKRLNLDAPDKPETL
jgi:hypothetical protein